MGEMAKEEVFPEVGPSHEVTVKVDPVVVTVAAAAMMMVVFSQ